MTLMRAKPGEAQLRDVRSKMALLKTIIKLSKLQTACGERVLS